MDISGIAVQGLDQADAQLTQAATEIAAYGGNALDGANLDVVDLSAEMVALMSAKVDFAANLKVVETADQVQKSLIDVNA